MARGTAEIVAWPLDRLEALEGKLRDHVRSLRARSKRNASLVHMRHAAELETILSSLKGAAASEHLVEIGRGEIEGAFGAWLLEDQKVREWAEARGVDTDGLIGWVLAEQDDRMHRADDLGHGGFLRVARTLAIHSFIAGMEVERHRRNAVVSTPQPADQQEGEHRE